MESIKKIRVFLKNNEIFFTTITAISLTVITVIITYQGNRNSERQTIISERQEKMDYFSNLPTFQINQNYLWNKDSTQLSGVELIVSKLDGTAKNIWVSTTSVLEIEYKYSDSKYTKDVIYIKDLFFIIAPTGKLNGDIFKINGLQDNMKNIISFTNELRDLFINDSVEQIIIEEETFIEINYVNFLNELEKNYYKLTPIGASLLYDIIDINYANAIIGRKLFNMNKKQININGYTKNEVKKMYLLLKNTPEKF